MEDVKIGRFGRFARITEFQSLASGNTPGIIGDPNRVTLRLVTRDNVAGRTISLAVPIRTAAVNPNPVLCVTNATPYDEITVERHGSLVQQAFDLTSSGISTLPTTVIEIIQYGEEVPKTLDQHGR
jgi:hypothetical protein